MSEKPKRTMADRISKPITLTAPPDLFMTIEELAKRKHWTTGGAIRVMVQNYLIIREFSQDKPELKQMIDKLEGND